jgi:hypothetical protein
LGIPLHLGYRSIGARRHGLRSDRRSHLPLRHEVLSGTLLLGCLSRRALGHGLLARALLCLGPLPHLPLRHRALSGTLLLGCTRLHLGTRPHLSVLLRLRVRCLRRTHALLRKTIALRTLGTLCVIKIGDATTPNLIVEGG